ncbi:hypothetical protein DYB37_011548 [Aphanomyces astaci]|uniref:BTB domain-containing protein n=1 Tax=Aphanomyces astaci TaxID=112090 RepID=A0A418E424_APHAT|nr:hypothetical protein DYB37_011548 [Aphanomyces astaci]
MRTGRHCGRLVTSTFAQDMASVALTAEFADTWFDWPADDDGLVVKIPAHRVVLCEAPYFASMLSGRFREASRDDASLSMAGMAADGMDVYVFQAALQWMYTGSRVELDAMTFDQGTEGTRKGRWLIGLCGIVVELLVMANMLGLDGLVSVCTSILSKLVATSKSSDVSSVCFEVAERAQDFWWVDKTTSPDTSRGSVQEQLADLNDEDGNAETNDNDGGDASASVASYEEVSGNRGGGSMSSSIESTWYSVHPDDVLVEDPEVTIHRLRSRLGLLDAPSYASVGIAFRPPTSRPDLPVGATHNAVPGQVTGTTPTPNAVPIQVTGTTPTPNAVPGQVTGTTPTPNAVPIQVTGTTPSAEEDVGNVVEGLVASVVLSWVAAAPVVSVPVVNPIDLIDPIDDNDDDDGRDEDMRTNAASPPPDPNDDRIVSVDASMRPEQPRDSAVDPDVPHASVLLEARDWDQHAPFLQEVEDDDDTCKYLDDDVVRMLVHRILLCEEALAILNARQGLQRALAYEG